MSLRTVAAIAALGRTAIGAALVAAPSAVGSKWIGDAAEDRRSEVALRAVGARDIALGLGTARAIHEDQSASGWLLACAASDAVDFGGTFAARDSLPDQSVTPTLLLAGGSAALCLAVALASD